MGKLMDRLYDDINEAKAFALSFTNFAYFYDDWENSDSYSVICEHCRKEIQYADYMMPKSSAKKDTSILHSLQFGVSPELRDELISRFDITESDFRPIRTKRGETVYYQITPQHKMLPLHEENEWPVMSHCTQCGNIRYDRPRRENQKGEPYYYIAQDVLEEMHDLNVTHEGFGRFDYPLYVISRRVYDYLTECYPRTHYFPFFLKGDVAE